MKRGKKLMILTVVCMAACGAAFAAIKFQARNEEEESSGVSIYQGEEDHIQALFWDYNGESLRFEKNGDQWQYAEDEEFPLQESILESMESALRDVQAVKVIEDPESEEEYGLDQPVCVVSVTGDSGISLSFGNETSLGGERYVSIGDGKIYILDSSLMDEFSYGLYDLTENETIPSMTDVTGITLEKGGETMKLIYQEADISDEEEVPEWFLEEKGGEYTSLDTDSVENLLNTFTGLSWGGCVNYHVSEEELKEYGLDEPEARVTVYYGEASEGSEDEDTSSEDESSQGQEFVLEIGGECDEGVYARMAGSQMVYWIDSSVYDSILEADEESLLSK
ncbi:MAG: DUF4340 domain-containing protein [Clostridiales bacterium]|nr:DUF4340 domain-containing protein [Clostridiales bacterium]